MNITRNANKSIKTSQKQESQIGITFDIQSLDLFCMYIMSENAYIRTSNLAMMKKLFDRIEISRYQNDMEKLLRLEFIRRGLEARLDKKIKNKNILLKYISGGLEDKPLMTYNFKELSSEEIDWINGTISESLKHAFMYDYIDEIMDLCTRFKAEDYNRRGDIVKEFEDIIDRVKKEFRRAKNESMTDIEFSLADGIFEEIMYDVYNRELNPSRRLLTGMQGFNELVGGGLESGRVYMLFGMAGAGKSLTMLNIAYQIKKYNKNYVCKDKTKRPCIVLLTMENSVHETITRLFSLITGERMNGFSIDEVIRKLREDGELVLNDESPIDIFIKYKPNMSIDTTYLYVLTDNLEDKGYEVICLLQDHVKRIRPAFSRHDLRLDLGEVVNDFKVFANEKDIPVISDSHLNRDGARIIDQALSARKGSSGNGQDITRLLGRSNVGESMLMIDNTDCGIILNKEYDKDGNEYMVFFRQKMRDQCTKRDYIAQPFYKGSTIRLVEDLYNPLPMFKETLYNPATLNTSNIHKNDYSDNITNLDDEDDTIFKKPISPMQGIHGSVGIAPQQISLSNMNFEVVGGPSTPIYNNYQQSQMFENPMEDSMNGYFDQNQYIPYNQNMMIPVLHFDNEPMLC